MIIRVEIRAIDFSELKSSNVAKMEIGKLYDKNFIEIFKRSVLKCSSNGI